MDQIKLRAFATSFVMSLLALNSHAQQAASGNAPAENASDDIELYYGKDINHPTSPDSAVLFIPEKYPEFAEMVKEIGKKSGIDDIEILVTDEVDDISTMHAGYSDAFNSGFLWVSNADFKNYSLPALRGVVGHEVGHMVLRLNKIPPDHLEEWRADSLTVINETDKNFTLWLQEYDNISKERITTFMAKASSNAIDGVKLTPSQDSIILDTRQINFRDPKVVQELREKYLNNKHIIRYIDAVEELHTKNQTTLPLDQVVEHMHEQFNQDLDKTTIHKSPVTRKEKIKAILKNPIPPKSEVKMDEIKRKPIKPLDALKPRVTDPDSINNDDIGYKGRG